MQATIDHLEHLVNNLPNNVNHFDDDALSELRTELSELLSTLNMYKEKYQNDILARLRKANIERDKEVFANELNTFPVEYWVMALAGEVGELANKVKKKMRLKGNHSYTSNISEDEISEEVADIQIYLDIVAIKLHIDLKEALIKKFNSSSKKFKSTITL